jgi:SAM-dependent methyltransferase
MHTSTEKAFIVNRQAWNQKAVIHAGTDFYDLGGFKSGNSSLNAIERNLLGDVRGKTLLHLQCHFGMDTLSWGRLGAHVTGVDFSDDAIRLANELAKAENFSSRFICCNVYDTRQYIQEKFDLVFTSYGTIGWLPDLEKWAEVISESLNPGGKFLIVDFHPVVWMLSEDFSHIKYPYSSKKNEPIVETLNGTYADPNADITTTIYSWNHSLADLIGALLAAGLQMDHFDELTYSPYNCFSNTEKGEDGMWRIKGMGDKLPMLYALTAVKPIGYQTASQSTTENSFTASTKHRT